MKLVHIGDVHVRSGDELPIVERQLAAALAEDPDHIIISGDLVDRWERSLLHGLRARLAASDLLDPSRLTVIHGNHDLASSGGWPRSRADYPRMVFRFWDPPPLLAWRRARFARMFGPASAPLPFERLLPSGLRVLAIDSTPLPFLPLTVHRREIRLRTALGLLRERDLDWLAARHRAPSILVMHHWPLPTSALRWDGGRILVPMHVEGDTDRFWRLLHQVGVRTVLCGHVHRTTVEQHGSITVAAQGQSGADWAGRPFSVYELAVDGSIESANVRKT